MSTGGLTVFPELGGIVIADNDFSTGRAAILLGDYKLISNIDFIPGINIAATAVELAAVINRLTGFFAVAGPTGVEFGWGSGPIDEVTLRAIHYGTVTNFTPVLPVGGFMLEGRPARTAPLLSP